MLAALAGFDACDVPHIVHHEVVDGRAIHTFTVCRGDPGPEYLAPTDHRRMHAAMTRLAELHHELRTLPCTDRRTWGWLVNRLATVRAGDRRKLPLGADRVLERIAGLIPTAELAPDVQWLHGDYHLGNLLWTGDEVTGIVDFDDTGCGSALAEAALSLFACARQATEDRFTYDVDLWNTGLAGYGAALTTDRDELMRMFCADQVLIHLMAAQRGLWDLTPGIGFWPCWAVLAE